MRILLLVVTNLAILLVVSLVTSLLGLNHWITAQGLNPVALLGFCAAFGFGGAFISLLFSKPIAKWTTGARVIEVPLNTTEDMLLSMVERLSRNAGLPMPEVAIYSGSPNAFATGPTKRNALVAVSTGLLQSMPPEEVEAVLAHEVAHIANGDMVTLTLVQGVMNTFVMFIARIVGYFIDRVVLKNEDEASGWAYMVTVIVLDILFGLLAAMVVAAVSRRREFRADAGAAYLLKDVRPMQAALRRLGAANESTLPANMRAFGIRGAGGVVQLFASHPPITARIDALEQLPSDLF